jgi:hypothetical protein
MNRKYTKWSVGIAAAIILFGFSFVLFYRFFYQRLQPQTPPQPTLSASVLDKPFPQSHLIDLSGKELESTALQHGKVVLVLVTPECGMCREEGQFLSTVVGRRSDVRFYGVVPLGESKEVLKDAEDKFPFKVYFDDSALLRRELAVNRVPAKLYLEDGIIKKTWVGSTAYYHTEDEFNHWLNSLH